MTTEQNQELPFQLQKGQGLFAGYTDKDMPLAAYAGLVVAYHIAFAVFRWVAQQTGQRLPERIGIADLVLLGVATHKLSRILAKDWVTSPLRAPFTQYQESAGAGEVNEQSRGTGLRRALGDLLTCPWCMGPWVAAALAYGLVLAPRATRLVASIFTLVAISDFLHHVYEAVKQMAK